MSNTIIVKKSDIFGYTAIDNRFISYYMRDADEKAVKVYLYGLMLVFNDDGDASKIGEALALTQSEVDGAYSYWENKGLVSINRGQNGNYAVRYLPFPECNATPGAASRYAALVEKLQLVLGTRNLTGSELQKVYDWIEIFRFEEDSALEIVRHCTAIKGARVHINYMDSVAKRLAADGILTYDAVKAEFEKESELLGGAAAILKRWRISRRPTEDELLIYEKWTKQWGFTEEAIGIACGEMVAVDRPSFRYLDAILSAYRQNGSVNPGDMKELMRRQDMLTELAREAFIRCGMKRNANARDRQQFDFWTAQYGMSAEMILFAAETSAGSANPFAEMKKLIEDWHKRGIGSFQAAKTDLDAKRDAGLKLKPQYPPKPKVNRALNYRQQKYSAEQLKALGIDLGEDIYNDED